MLTCGALLGSSRTGMLMSCSRAHQTFRSTDAAGLLVLHEAHTTVETRAGCTVADGRSFRRDHCLAGRLQGDERLDTVGVLVLSDAHLGNQVMMQHSLDA